VELLPGASSALYGANAFNGILFMTSQSPFTSQGLLRYAKFGQTSQKLLGQTTMLIMELEWRMRLVQTCRKANFTCAVQIGMLQTTTTKRTLVETEVM
jgi:hypothetical protein